MFLTILQLCYLFSFGGPDGYGYLFLATKDGDPLYFHWEDITETGTRLDLGDDDYVAIDLPFSFPFYDALYNYAFIGSNGLIYFADQYVGIENECLPTHIYDVGDLIALYWSDLNPEDSLAGVYYQNFGNYTVIEYHMVPIVGLSGRNTFEVILTPTGYIELLYLHMESYSDETIGIQDATAISGNHWYLEYVCEGEPSLRVPSDSSAVLYIPPWVSAKETRLTIKPIHNTSGKLLLCRPPSLPVPASLPDDFVDLFLFRADGRTILKVPGIGIGRGESNLTVPGTASLPSGIYRVLLRGRKTERRYSILLLH